MNTTGIRTLSHTLLLAGLVSTATDALAGPEHPGHGHGADLGAPVHRHLAASVKQLGLEEAQKAAIRDIFESNRADLKANRLASKELRTELEAVFEADVFDGEALAELARREGALAEERVLLLGTVASEVLAELDDTQRAELQAIREARKDRRRERFGARQDRG